MILSETDKTIEFPVHIALQFTTENFNLLWGLHMTDQNKFVHNCKTAIKRCKVFKTQFK